MKLYHVTLTKNVTRIRKQGLRRFQTSQWVRASDGERYGNGEVYAFTDRIDALRWAGKMDWALHTGTGTGKIAIVEFEAAEDYDWQIDHSDPMSQAGRNGDWLKSEYPVRANQITGSYPVSTPLLRECVL